MSMMKVPTKYWALPQRKLRRRRRGPRGGGLYLGTNHEDGRWWKIGEGNEGVDDSDDADDSAALVDWWCCSPLYSVWYCEYARWAGRESFEQCTLTDT